MGVGRSRRQKGKRKPLSRRTGKGDRKRDWNVGRERRKEEERGTNRVGQKGKEKEEKEPGSVERD